MERIKLEKTNIRGKHVLQPPKSSMKSTVMKLVENTHLKEPANHQQTLGTPALEGVGHGQGVENVLADMWLVSMQSPSHNNSSTEGGMLLHMRVINCLAMFSLVKRNLSMKLLKTSKKVILLQSMILTDYENYFYFPSPLLCTKLFVFF